MHPYDTPGMDMDMHPGMQMNMHREMRMDYPCGTHATESFQRVPDTRTELPCGRTIRYVRIWRYNPGRCQKRMLRRPKRTRR